MSEINLTNNFLIAMPGMTDPYFANSLTYICEHNESGALGIVINKPIDLTLQSLFEQVGLVLERDDLMLLPVYFGGPVQMDRGFVLHQPGGSWQSSLLINEEMAFTTSKDILTAITEGGGPERLLITLGYAGWEAGQLESELAANGWLNVEADPSIIFDLPPEERLTAAMEQLGIDKLSLSDQVGHA